MKNYSMEDKYRLIMAKALKATSKNPVEIARSMMDEEVISMHGPEHHFLDGAAFLAAYKNAGGQIDLASSLEALAERAFTMPGAMCGYWGVCGSVASVGAAMSIIDKTGPLSSDDHYKEHMEYASSVLALMSKIGGPRCCKRNAFLSLSQGVSFMKNKYGVPMELGPIVCDYHSKNSQCLEENCPFFRP
jgi:hypothetical protein